MAFTGIIKAPKIVPSAFGLFVVAKPNSPVTEDQWVRGFSQEWETRPNYGRNWDETSNTDEVLFSDASAPLYSEHKAFFIEVEDQRSTFNLVGEDRFARVLRQLEGISQHGCEVEFWDGAIAQGESLSNPYLTKASSVTTLNSGTALSPRRAVALLEHYIGQTSAGGEQGIIHMTRDTAALLSSTSNMLFHDKDKEHLQTVGGTPVVVGSGYSGNGPVGATGATATDTNKWIYATGTVRVLLGEPDVVNDNLAQGYDVAGNANDMKIKAVRAASVYFDTSIHLAVRVDLTA
jgi:hypothetical protein